MCAATVSGLGEREGSWELKELAAGGSVSSVCEQIFLKYMRQIKKKSLRSGYSRKRMLRVRNAQARPEPSNFRYEDPEEYSEPSRVCVDCLQGQYMDVAGLISCKTCLPLTSSYNYPQVSCQCDAGYTFDNLTARTLAPEDRVSVICQTCEQGTFENEHCEHECSAFPAHSSSPNASIAVTSCQCDPGFFDADGGRCMVCPVHTCTSETGTASCQMCPANTVSESENSVLTYCLCDSGYTADWMETLV